MIDLKKISILGSSGSIGTQTLDILRQNREKYAINYLTVNSSVELLEEQCEEFAPKGVVINDFKAYEKFKLGTSFGGEILYGEEQIEKIAEDSDNDLVVSALVGFAGVKPTYAAINAGIDIALANKETLVSAGSLIMETAKKKGVNIIAVDSEHSAILQCLAGENYDDIEKIILTASGGPFRSLPVKDFKDISLEEALNHPNWDMGDKITIDSATMMNKGLELIEAYWLFDVKAEQMDVVVHKESIIHSMVQFRDGSVKAQLGLPDMRIPISHALTFPRHDYYDFPRLDLTKIMQLNFEKPDLEKFSCLRIAMEVLGNNPDLGLVLNAANEVAVSNFLNRKIEFNDIPKLIELAIKKFDDISCGDLETLVEIDKETRVFTETIIKKENGNNT